MIERLGPYVVEAELGRGGMGVVYRARDTRLNRTVAIKALPPELSGDAGRLERFEREARTLAQLNHPNLAGIHGLEEHGGQRYLVLEFVEGETLADRLDRGPLAVDEAVALAAQIAAGVSAAHEIGVIHRDLKPANIIITPEGQAKVLDFGLARTDEGQSSTGSDLSQSPTLTAPERPQHSPTIPGAILGTAAYMSPEQARGRRVDRRSDVWSFGVLLYEMLVGASPFVGETASDSIGAVLHKSFDLSQLPPGTPSNVRRVLRRCLQRDRDLRYHNLADARLELLSGSVDATGDGDGATPRPIGAWAIAAVLLALVGGVFFGRAVLAPNPPAPTPLHVAVPVENVRVPDGPDSSFFDIDPGATRLAYIATDPSSTSDEPVSSIYLRDLDQPEAVRLAGTEHARWHSFDPTGKWIAFSWEPPDGGRWELRRIAIDGRAPLTIFQDPRRYSLGGPPTWVGPDRLAVIGDDSLSVHLVDASGGMPRELIDLPEAIPSAVFVADLKGSRDGSMLTMSIMEQDEAGFPRWMVYEIDTETGDTRLIVEGGFLSVVDDCFAVFFRDNTLLAAPWDADTKSLSGAPVAVMSDPGNDTIVRISTTGVLAYTSSKTGRTLGRVMSITRDGTVEPVSDLRRQFGGHVRVSPDGNKLALMILDDPDPSVHVLDLRTGYLRLGMEVPIAVAPTWTPDGRLVVNRIFSIQDQRFYVRDLDAGPDPEPLFGVDESLGFTMATTFSPDGSLAFVNMTDPVTGESDLYAVDMETFEQHPMVVSELDNRAASLSPDGTLLAYLSGPSDRVRVTVSTFDRETLTVGPPVPVSREGCRAPTWTADGSELFWHNWNSDNIMVASVRRPEDPADTGFTIGTPEVLFTRDQAEFELDWSDYPIAASPDGERFYYTEDLGSREDPTYVNLILNWDVELERLLGDK